MMRCLQRFFQLYMNRLDPAHYYFLSADVAEYRKYETRIDDMLLRGNSKIVFGYF